MRAAAFAILFLSGVAHAQAPAGGLPLPVDVPSTTSVSDGGVLENDPEAPSVGASLDRTEAFVGDKLTLTVTAIAHAGVVVSLPARIDLGKLELLSREGEDKGRDLGDGRRSYRVLLGVAAYETGDLEIPSLPLTYVTARGDVRTVHTSPLNVHIRSLVAPDEAKPEAQPPRPPRSALVEDKRIMRAVRIGAIVLGGGVLLMVVGLLLRRSLRRQQAEELAAAPPRPADEIAVERLRAIRAAGDFGRDGYRPFYFAVAEVVRGYLGARYGFDSLELTTTELVDELHTHATHLVASEGGPGGKETEVVRFLSSTDMVKFANAGSTHEEAEGVLDAALAIVLSTAQPLESAAAQAATTAGPVLLPRPPSGDEGKSS